MSILDKLPKIDEEREMIAEARRSRAGMGKLLQRYEALVHVNAHKWKNKGRVSDAWKHDLYQEGYIGLMHAVNTYDDERETKFTTWAVCCIEGAIRNLAGYCARSVK